MATEIKLKDEERQPCEVWTRVMGYFRPVSAFNIGKKSEYAERVCFSEKKATERFMAIAAE
jgi:hypothetical protein